jgi:predicted transcriptional regulator of viral defense system
MKFLGQLYYVALLSAAEIHGAAHQRPQTYQVMTSRPTRDVVAAGLRIRFFKKENLTATPTIPTRTFTGDILVSSPAATAFDLVAYARRVGRLNRVMTVLQELGENIEADGLVTAAKTVESACVQRTGWLLDKAGFEPLTGKLNEWFVSQATKVVALDPSRPAKGCVRDRKWRVIVNAEAEGEL